MDDLCVEWRSLAAKVNYQAKNSSGAAADWSEAIEWRFGMQDAIDRGVYGCQDHARLSKKACFHLIGLSYRFG